MFTVKFWHSQKKKWEISLWPQVRSYMVLGWKILYNPFRLVLLRKNTARGFKQIFRWLSFNGNVRGKVAYSSALSENTRGVLQEDWMKWHYKHMLLFCILWFQIAFAEPAPPHISFLERMQARVRHCDSDHVQSVGKGPFVCPALCHGGSRRLTLGIKPWPLL